MNVLVHVADVGCKKKKKKKKKSQTVALLDVSKQRRDPLAINSRLVGRLFPTLLCAHLQTVSQSVSQSVDVVC